MVYSTTFSHNQLAFVLKILASAFKTYAEIHLIGCICSTFCQVLELEQQHSAALQELSQTYTCEKEQLIEQHQLRLQVCVRK